jgi:hypothetical protein
MMMVYGIQIADCDLAAICGDEYAWEVWFKTKELAALLGVPCVLTNANTNEVISDYHPYEEG